MKKRVYEVAEDLKIPTKGLIDFLIKEGIDVKNHMSTLDDETIEIIKEAITEERKKEKEAEKEKKNILVVDKLPTLKELSLQLNIPLLEIMQQASKWDKIQSIDRELSWEIVENIYNQYNIKISLSNQLKKSLKVNKTNESDLLLTIKSPVITIVGHVDQW
jgi:translation initiation factor IF-2